MCLGAAWPGWPCICITKTMKSPQRHGAEFSACNFLCLFYAKYSRWFRNTPGRLSRNVRRPCVSGEHQPPQFEGAGRDMQDLRMRTGIIPMPVKDSHTRIKPLTLASGQGRYIAVTSELILFCWGMAVTASLPKQLCDGRFTSETASCIQKQFKMPIGTSRRL